MNCKEKEQEKIKRLEEEQRKDEEAKKTERRFSKKSWGYKYL